MLYNAVQCCTNRKIPLVELNDSYQLDYVNIEKSNFDVSVFVEIVISDFSHVDPRLLVGPCQYAVTG